MYFSTRTGFTQVGVALSFLFATVSVYGSMPEQYQGNIPEEAEEKVPTQCHPADGDLNWRLVMGEAIAYLAGWQQGTNPMAYAIRAAYLWQNGEQYVYDAFQDAPLCWTLADEGEPGIMPPEMVPVAAGTFQMGNPWLEDGAYSDEIPVHEVYLDAYQIGRYEVTNQQYAEVLNWAHGQGYLTDVDGAPYTGGVIYAHGVYIADTQTSWSYSKITYSEGVFGVRNEVGYGGLSYSMENHPMVNVSWYGAVCYCNWMSVLQGLEPCYDTGTWERYEPVRNGYRLPTEAEWERAAAWDGSKHWRYGITSDTIDFARVNFLHELPEDYANPQGLKAKPYTAPVGWYNGVNFARLSLPDISTVNSTSPVGAYDMSGNMMEWCHDWYHSEYYANSPAVNPSGVSESEALGSRVMRGGAWLVEADGCRSARRYSSTPDFRNCIYLGFRVARVSDKS